MMNRRKFLKMSGGSLGVASGFAANLASFNAYGANTSGYKALVCIFLRGGMDTHDMVIPYDLSTSRDYETIRAPIIDSYTAAGFESRRRENLLRLQGIGSGFISDAGPGDGRAFAFPREFTELQNLYRQGKLAIVGNVGPLEEPTNRATFKSGAVQLPPRLFSHNDQEAMWMAGTPEGATTGWGGRFGDMMQASNANQYSTFTSVTTNGTRVFAQGFSTGMFHLSGSGGLELKELNGQDEFSEAYAASIHADPGAFNNVFMKDVVNITGNAVTDNLLVKDVFATGSNPVTTVFPASSIGSQLSVVAKMIAHRNTFGNRRQIFIVSDIGYDTHSFQGEALPVKHAMISQAMAAFYKEMAAQGVENDVVQFTASDFGRSLVPNANGTDHGWGSHHMVLGGDVGGGRFYGGIPDIGTEHSQDAGAGRLIPEVSVDQYAYALGRWFGLGHGEATEVLPGINNFNNNALRGMVPW